MAFVIMRSLPAIAAIFIHVQNNMISVVARFASYFFYRCDAVTAGTSPRENNNRVNIKESNERTNEQTNKQTNILQHEEINHRKERFPAIF